MRRETESFIVKQQYLGDVNDYRKYFLLRHFADGGKVKVGVCWMLTPDDGGKDGRKIAYLDDPAAWRSADPELFDQLRHIVHGDQGRLLANIEGSNIIPGVRFFDRVMPDDRDGRASYMTAALAQMQDCDLIFFDPDNGIEVPSIAKGRKNSSKYIYWDEIAAAFRPNCSVLIYQHFGRESRAAFVSRLAGKLRETTDANEIWAIHSPHVLFILATSDARVANLPRTVPARSGIETKHL